MHGNAVTVEVERDSSGVSLIVWQNEQKKQNFDCGIIQERYSVPVQCLMTAAIVR
ncbi:MAG: hypothetical protein ACLTD2_14340 [Ruminococcus sp.]